MEKVDSLILVLEAAEFEKRVGQTPGMAVLDVRTRAEYKTGYIPGATNIPIEDSRFYGQVSRMNRQRPVGIYCDGSQRSSIAAETMRNIGFTTVYVLRDGVYGWEESGRVLVRD